MAALPWLLASYLLGAVPTSYLAGRLFRGIDLREHGSRNLGATNLYRVLTSLLERNAPPQKPGEEVKLLYASQIAVAPPTFAIVSNRPEDVPEAYQRYLVHGFREAWPFAGSPLRLKFTARGSRR